MTEEDAFAVCDRFAESYAETNSEVEAREGYEWKMVQRLLPNVEGQRVLDAGTGTGNYAALLANRGADVVGIDASERMIAQARDRHGDVGSFIRVELRDPLPFDDGLFDVVLCQLTLEHVRDWDPLLAEFARVLDGGGQLVVSTDHPFSTYFVIEPEPPEIGSADADSADYYAIERYSRNWGEEGDPLRVPFFRRPLREVLKPLFSAGFVLGDLLEPPPDTDDDLLGYFDDELPRFLGFRARLSGSVPGRNTRSYSK